MASQIEPSSHAAAQADDTKDSYIFKRSWRSSMRLNYQHYLMREIAGYLTHPEIPIDQPDLRVADIGTGTGIWACELAARLPTSARIDAFDISDDQFPAPGFWPKNVAFHTHDSFMTYPAEFQGQFDLVHARFLVCVVNDPTAQSFVDKLVSLLKPGGYLQWFEPFPRQVKALALQEGAETTFAARHATLHNKPEETSEYDWTDKMPGLLEAAGLKNIQHTRHNCPDHLRPMWTQACLAIVDDTARNLDQLATGDSGREHGMVTGLEKELRQGAAVDTPFQCVIGRKPPC